MATDTRKVVLELLARNRAKGELAAFRGGIDRTFRSVRRMATGIVAMAGVGGIGYMIRQQMKAIDATAKMSDELDISTRTLAGLDHAAKISGTSIENVHKAIEIFVRRLGEAKQGVGEAKVGLEMLGLEAKDLINLGTEEAFLKIADAIAKAENSADRSVIAFKFFGRQGMALINMLKEGRGSIQDLIKEADKLGLTFDRIDAAKVEAANDALTRTKAVFTGLFRQTTIELAPYIEAAATAFNDWATAGEGVGANVTNAFEIMTLSIVRAGEEIENLVVKMNRLLSPVETAKKNFAAIEAATKRYREYTGEGRRLRPGQPELFEQFYMEERARRGLEAGASRESEVRKWFEDLRARTKTPAADLMGGMPVSETDLLNKRLQEEYGPRDVGESGRTADQLREAMNTRVQIHNEGLQRILAQEQEKMEIARGFQEQIKADWVTFWDPVIEGSMKADEAVRNFFRNFLVQLAQAQAQIAMLNLLNAGVGGLIGGLSRSFMGMGMSPQAMFAKAPYPVHHNEGIVGRVPPTRWVNPGVFKNAQKYHNLQPDEVAVIAQEGEMISRSRFSSSNIESLLGQILGALEQRQTIKAMIVDSRDVVTRGQMEGRDGEQFVMRHIQRNQ